jgi:hypothetical protein
MKAVCVDLFAPTHLMTAVLGSPFPTLLINICIFHVLRPYGGDWDQEFSALPEWAEAGRGGR